MYKFIILFFTILFFKISNCEAQKPKELLFYDIPAINIDLYKSINIDDTSFFRSVNAFQISEFITLIEYKAFLSDSKKDSSTLYYEKQLPNIKNTSPEKIQEYLTDKKYENYPVVGVSWYNAMEFCKWKTAKENPDSLQFIYRLPITGEWLAAFSFFNENKIANDFNQKYSDWLLNSADIPVTLSLNRQFFEYISIYKLKEGAKFNRNLSAKLVIGNSFVKKNMHVIDFNTYFALDGFKHISFRVVKENVQQLPQTNENLAPESNDIQLKQSIFSFGNKIAKRCLNYWEWKR